MKKILVLVSVLGLCACGGGGGGHPAGVVTPNDAPVPKSTIIASVNNQAETVSYATAHGLPDDANYEAVVQAFQNMYNIGNGTNTSPTQDELRSAYLLAGGSADSFDAETAQGFIASNYSYVLDNFFAETENGTGYVWEPKTQSISDITFFSNDGYDVIKMNVAADGQITSFKTSEETDIDNGGWLVWNKIGGNKYTTNNVYSYQTDGYGAWYTNMRAELDQYSQDNGYNYGWGGGDGDFSVVSQNQLSLDQIKQYFKGQIRSHCWGCNDNQVAFIANKIDQLTENDLYTARVTDFQTTLNAFGQNLGLSYADFGYTNVTGNVIEQNGSDQIQFADVFYGGYDVKLVDRPQAVGTRFNGTAVAKVEHFWYDADADEEFENTMITHTNDAHLTLGDGIETLQMNFSSAANPWYDVTVINNLSDPSQHTATLSNTNNVESRIGQEFRLSEAGRTAEVVDTESLYYGDNGTASEVINNTFMGFDDARFNEFEGIEVDSVFGGKRAE